MPLRDPDPVSRFWRNVDRGDPDDCWLWRAGTVQGYGQFAVRHGERTYAHRFAYELHVGPIADGLTLDHVCHTRDATCPPGPTCPHRRCCNPAHAEQVPRGANARRRTRRPADRCRYGHPLVDGNVYVTPAGNPECRECRRAADRAYRQRQLEAATAVG